MNRIDNENFGQFVQNLRKEKGFTQKQLAEELFVSDKAVSKWERGLSLPDISLLMPLAKILDVTVTELLSGKRIEKDEHLTVVEVEDLMNKTIVLSKEEEKEESESEQSRKKIFGISLFIFIVELLLFFKFGYAYTDLFVNIGTTSLLMLIFGTYLTFFAKERLPVYYDENKISFYSDGIFRMNIVGLSFNNSNWKHILRATHLSSMSILVIYPILYFILSGFKPMYWEKIGAIASIVVVFSLFVPIYVVGKKYE